MRKLNANIGIQKLRENIAKDVGSKKFTEKLRIKILKKWCNVRFGAFVNVYVQVMR